MKKCVFIFLLVTASAALLFSAAESEAASSTTYGLYLAGSGTIIPPDSVHVDSYIAQLDYNYPQTAEPVGLYPRSGNRQISSSGETEYIHIGIRGGKAQFDELPPMNLAFVIDKSGSMEWENKMDWVKKSFDVFLSRVRDKDFVSLIVFDNSAKVVFPSTRMDSPSKREMFRETVGQIMPGGGTNLNDGLQMGYQEVLSNYRSDYTNRVLFLTDGVGDADRVLEMAKTFRDMDIYVSTIGLGSDFDVNLMVELARTGGGSSRFINDEEQMEKTFGSELDRMVVAAARNLDIKVTLPSGAKITGTWGYQNVIADNTASYKLGTLHNGDYETILIEAELPELPVWEDFPLATVDLSYDSTGGGRVTLPTQDVIVNVVDAEYPLYGVSDSVVLQSSTMLRLGRGLQNIGSLYYEGSRLMNSLTYEQEDQMSVLRYSRDPAEIEARAISEEVYALNDKINGYFRQALEESKELRKQLVNTRMRLDDIGFDDEISILDSYLDIIGRDLAWEDAQIAEAKADTNLDPDAGGRAFLDHLTLLFDEVALSVKTDRETPLAVSGFVLKDTEEAPFLDILNESAVAALSDKENLRLIERDRLKDVLAEQKLQLSGLMDTETALEIGRLVSAEMILTGSVIPMASSVLVFCRIINVTTGEIVSVSQVNITLDEELKELML